MSHLFWPIVCGAAAASASFLVGCASRQVNPSFPLTRAEANDALAAMDARPKRLARPLVILSGWQDPGVACVSLRWRLEKLTRDAQIICVSFPLALSFEDCRKKTIEAVEKAVPSSDPQWTTEVDVVAVSMGGLVGRLAAAGALTSGGNGDGHMAGAAGSRWAKRLRVARLFTISTPHRGANLAGGPIPGPILNDMRADSEFLKALDARLGDGGYELYPYTRLDDVVVGQANTAPPGRTPWWVDTPPLSGSHLNAHSDPRIVADIARRLRGEEPLTSCPAAPLPAGG